MWPVSVAWEGGACRQPVGGEVEEPRGRVSDSQLRSIQGEEAVGSQDAGSALGGGWEWRLILCPHV